MSSTRAQGPARDRGAGSLAQGSSGRGSRHHRCRSGDVGGTRLVEAMGGTISATDTPGRRLSGDRSAAPEMTLVLVIDDEPQILRALRINLTVRKAARSSLLGPVRVARAAAEHPPDAVISTSACRTCRVSTCSAAAWLVDGHR